MRKRKWQTVFFILLIIVCSFIYLRIHHLYFTPEEVLYACERGLRSGPSEEIIFQFDLEDGGKVLVGRQEDGIFVVPAERSHGFLWQMQSGSYVEGFVPYEDGWTGSLTYGGNYLGICQDEDVSEVSFIIGNWPERSWKEYICPVELIEGELIFIGKEEIFKGEEYDEMEDQIVYTEGRDADGQVLYWEGDDGLAKSLRSGNFMPDKVAVTKQYITVPATEEN